MPRTAAALLVATLLVVSGCVSSSGSGGSVGLSVGGAQDANAFRDDVHNGYVPQPTDVTSEGLFHDYCFDTGQSRPCEERFVTVQGPITEPTGGSTPAVPSGFGPSPPVAERSVGVSVSTNGRRTAR